MSASLPEKSGFSTKLLFLQKSKGFLLLLLLLLTGVLYGFMVFVTIPFLQWTSGGLRVFDLMPGGYDALYTEQLLSALGSEGRLFYLFRQLPLDFVFPGLFAVSGFLTIRWLLFRLQDTESPWRFTGWLAVIGAIFDYAENVCIAFLLKSYPEISEMVVRLASFCTISKSLLTTFYFFGLLAVLFMFGRRSFQAVKV
jgi:hypothetical protein